MFHFHHLFVRKGEDHVLKLLGFFPLINILLSCFFLCNCRERRSSDQSEWEVSRWRKRGNRGVQTFHKPLSCTCTTSPHPASLSVVAGPCKIIWETTGCPRGCCCPSLNWKWLSQEWTAYKHRWKQLVAHSEHEMEQARKSSQLQKD